jgi:hypothetical protein
MESGESAVLNRRFNLGHSCARGVLDLFGGTSMDSREDLVKLIEEQIDIEK